jgi:hypothetical protein
MTGFRDGRGAWLGSAVLAGAVLGTVGCASLRMVPPQDVAGTSDVFEATGRSPMSGALVDESFRIGPYAVAAVERDGQTSGRTSSGEASLVGTFLRVSRDDIRNGYAYRFQEGPDALAGRCEALTERKEVAIGERNQVTTLESTLVCTCGSGDGAAKLVLGHAGTGPCGQVTLARGTLDVMPVRETNAAWRVTKPAGFLVGKGPDAIGAVEVLRPGRLWVSKALDAAERRQLGCLLAGVMLDTEAGEQ